MEVSYKEPKERKRSDGKSEKKWGTTPLLPFSKNEKTITMFFIFLDRIGTLFREICFAILSFFLMLFRC